MSPSPTLLVEQPKLTLRSQFIEQITQPSDRDKQRRVGPSGLGDACPLCLAKALAGESDERSFSMYPWLGTAVHYYLEDHVFPDAEHELKLYCGDVPGYGKIYGTTDLYWDKTVGDWKIVGLKRIKSFRVNGPPQNYRYQAMIYAKGAELSGREVEDIAIVFIPRDSGNPQDIWVYEEPYQPEMADAALERAGVLYNDFVLTGKIDELPSDDDCFNCNGYF